MKQAAMIQTRKETQAPMTVRKFLLICGILSSLLYVGTDIVAAMLYPGYSYTSQQVSVYEPMLWVLVLGVVLLRGQKDHGPMPAAILSGSPNENALTQRGRAR